MADTKHSARYALVKRYYDKGLWSKARVAKAVEYAWVTADEYADICGEALSETTEG